MGKWIQLNSDELNPPRHESIRGVDVVVFLSPYDVPEAVSGDYDDEIKKFVIAFRYIVEDEPFARQTGDSVVTLRVGKNSGRLYGIEVDVDKIRADSINLFVKIPEVVQQAIDKLESNPRHRRRRGNYRVAKKVISERGRELFSGLTPR